MADQVNVTDPDASAAASDAWDLVAAAWGARIDDIERHTAAATAALLERLAIQTGERVLELAAGPGILAPTWAELVGPTGSVHLSDLAPAMVELEEGRASGLDNVTASEIDASAIDRPDGSFDVVACRMGLMFTPDPPVALAEIHRVLDDGGRIGLMTWGAIEANPWMTCVGMAAMVNGLVTGGPPVGPGGIFSLSDPEHVRSMLEAAGFADVHVDEHDVEFRADDIDAHIDRVTALAGPLAVILRRATPDQLGAVRRTATDLAAPYLTDDGLVIPGRAVLATGRVG